MTLSPPPSRNSEMFQHDLHHLVAHNANTSYPQPKYDPDEGIHMQTHYESPISHEDQYMRRPQQTSYPYQHQHQDSGLGIQYEYHDFQGPVYQDQYSTPASSPTPPSQDMIRTRSGLTVQRGGHQTLRPMPEGRHRTEKSPKMKKAKKEKVKAEKKVAKLDKPLSELTKDWKHVPVADIETYVNRSAEERRREVDEGKVPGKVKRPMNSFMLYRKAYQNRTKDWCLQNNHQVVSQVCGDSWPLEPDAVKEQFSEWARLERINHQNAHPGYKFSPTKPGAGKAAKRKMSEDIASDDSDLTDFDWQGGGQSKKRRNLRNQQRPMQQQPVMYPTTRSAYHYSSREHSMEPSYANYNKSAYQLANPGKQPPAQYNQAGMQPGEYYQQTIQSSPLVAGVEDVIIKKTPAPGVHSYQVSIPGGRDFDIMHPQPHYTPSPQPDFRIDPSLMTQDHGQYENSNYHEGHPDGVYFGSNHEAEHAWQSGYGMSDRDMDPALQYLPEQHVDKGQIHDQQMDILRGHQEGWQIETLDSGREFDNWMGAGEE
ncbi:similar to transcription factor HMG [Botrytis cinerea T4]|uniref:Similar to transcription factor HMG n=1 Tax=Botryotinia fuckeliana (strain T4) TaxID=999810 RepID=G2YEZ8_BOTF4|nr:similar to transcription factor HMG [Botrytis cinerea T4]